MIERMDRALPISQQCGLLALPRSSVYRKPAAVSAEDLAIMALIDRHYLARPYYGSRRMAAWLATQGHRVNRKRVQRQMRLLGLAAIYQRPNTSKPAAAHKIYPYLLRGLAIERVNQVWCSDVTYIPMAKGFVYLVVIMDWVSRAVLAWRLSNTLDADFYHHPKAAWCRDQHGRQEPAPRRRGAGASTTSSLSGCGAVSNTRRSISMPIRQWPKPRPALAPGWNFTTRSTGPEPGLSH